MHEQIEINEIGCKCFYHTINGKYEVVVSDITEIIAAERYNLKIWIFEKAKFKAKGGINKETLSYDIFIPIIDKIHHYYKTALFWKHDYDGLNKVSEDSLEFQIVDGDFKFAKSIVQDYLECFE